MFFEKFFRGRKIIFNLMKNIFQNFYNLIRILILISINFVAVFHLFFLLKLIYEEFLKLFL